MIGKNFINFHVLMSHSPSCLNRDDLNMQKTAVFGGVNRVRVSSQSLKQAMRRSDYYKNNLGKPSFRTRDLGLAVEKLVESLKGEFEKELIKEAANRFVSTQLEIEEEDAEQNIEDAPVREDVKGQKKKLAVAPWVIEEIKIMCQIIREVKKENLDDKERAKALKKVGKTVGKGSEKRELIVKDCLALALDEKINKRLEERAGILRSAIGKAIDIAFAGRMATKGLMLPVDGALSMAHAITTHAVEPQDVDWFTAVDDLIEDSGDTGAGHLDTQQFSSGVFYRYASLNLKQLQVNMGLLPNMNTEETAETRKRALEVAGHFFYMLATIIPTAKQHSFAAHNLADFAIVTFADQPISLANAFESPVAREKEGGYLIPSITTLNEYWRKMNNFYSLNEQAAVATSRAVKLSDNLKPCPTIKDLKEWVGGDGAEK
jgi:CRISPR system Cascade subunit CasC